MIERSGFASKLSQVYQSAYFTGERGLHVVLLVLKLLFYLNNTIPTGAPGVNIQCDLPFPLPRHRSKYFAVNKWKLSCRHKF